MPVSQLLLAIVLFLYAAGHLGWFLTSGTLLGVVELVTAILLVVEGAPVLYKKYVVR
jgi:hypothetical protein